MLENHVPLLPSVFFQGPAYDVQHGHKFPADGKLDVPDGGFPTKPMEYPVMDVLHKNQYKPGEPIAHDHSELAGPKFKIDREHQFSGKNN